MPIESPFKQAGKAGLAAHRAPLHDPVDWITNNLGITCYSNQIEDIEDLFNEDLPAFNILGTRGIGKSHGIAAGLGAYCILYAGLRVIISAPKEKQAGRIVKEVKMILKSKKSKVSKEVDWNSSSQNRIQFKNGSYIVALSGQETANVEGEHGHILVLDEAHKIPTFSVTNKLGPMIGMLSFAKTIKIGVAIGKNHFYKSCMAEDAKVNKTPWRSAEIFLDKPKDKLVLYKKRYYSKELIRKMPVPYKVKYFPDRPDLQKATGDEVSVADWENQYELIWSDDVLNFLSDEDQKHLFVGSHDLLTRGIPGEIYCAGLDTAQGSLVGRAGTDETVLCIWRIRKDGSKEKVATFIWVGKPLEQQEEIWQIINPENGLFKCKMTLVDYSNIGINITEMFAARKVPILGKHFGSTEQKSKKNWKNALFDHFQIQTQTGKVFYGDLRELEKRVINAVGEMETQIKNTLRGAWEWGTLQRIRGRGRNDTIEAPNEKVEGEDGSSERAFDDVCCSDVLAVYACDHLSELETEAKEEVGLSNYSIPMAVVGMGASVLNSPGAVFGLQQNNGRPLNPMAQAEAQRERPGTATVGPAGDGANWMSSLLVQMKKKGR